MIWPRMKTTIGENIFASVLSAVAAAFTGIVGFVGGIFLCGWLLNGEMTEWGLVVGPGLALAMAAVTSVIVFRKIIHYGEGTSSQSGE